MQFFLVFLCGRLQLIKNSRTSHFALFLFSVFSDHFCFLGFSEEGDYALHPLDNTAQGKLKMFLCNSNPLYLECPIDWPCRHTCVCCWTEQVSESDGAGDPLPARVRRNWVLWPSVAWASPHHTMGTRRLINVILSAVMLLPVVLIWMGFRVGFYLHSDIDQINLIFPYPCIRLRSTKLESL